MTITEPGPDPVAELAGLSPVEADQLVRDRIDEIARRRGDEMAVWARARAERFRAEIDAGKPVKALAAELGITKQRLYKILGDRRKT